MPKRIFFFTDIDDTLIQTKRKTNFSKNTVVGAYNKQGEAHSFFYEGTKVLIDSILDTGINVIPTTARNLDSYKRTIFYENTKIQYAILNFGGLILINNEVDSAWKASIEEKYNELCSMKLLYENLSSLLKEAKLEVDVKIIDNYYISIYNRYHLNVEKVIVKIREVLHLFLHENSQYYLYENDNSFGILPKFLNKKFAVEYLINIHSPILTIGAGDNISDLDFMQLTNFKLLPEKFIL
ncbi:MAG: HAD family hydrolase [Campylobacterota bacterium]|nr:HAD family hydrolase [Campylobacterota bacterium]